MSEPATDLKTQARRAVPFAATAGVFQIVVSLLGMLLLVRYLEPDAYGTWMILIGLVAPVLLVLSLGHLQTVLRFLPALESAEARSELLWSVAARRFVVAAIVLAAGWAAFPWIADRLGVAGHREVFALLLPGFAVMAANEYFVAALNTAFRQRDVLIGALAHQTAFVGGVALGILDERGLAYFAAVYSGSASLQAAINFRACWIAYGPPRPSRLARRPAEDRERRRYRLTSYVDDLGTMLLSSPVNRLVLAALDSTGQVALYAVASNIVDRLRALQPLQIFRPLATVSIFSRYEQSGSIEDLNRMFRVLHAANTSVTLLYLVLFVPLGRELLVVFFRPEYADAYWPAVFLFATISIFALPFGLVAQTVKRPQALVWAKLAVLLNLGLGIPLALRYGATGMALAAMGSGLAKNLITYGVVRLEFPVRFPVAMSLRFLAAGTVGVLAMEALALVVPRWSVAPVGVAVYALALRTVRVLDESERALLVSLLPERSHALARRLVG